MKLDLPSFKVGLGGSSPQADINDKLVEIGKTEQKLAQLKEEVMAERRQQPQPNTVEEINSGNSISKKAAAYEVLKQLKVIRLFGIGGIVGVFLLLLAATFSAVVSYALAFLLILPAAVYVNKTQTELRRLKENYNL